MKKSLLVLILVLSFSAKKSNAMGMEIVEIQNSVIYRLSEFFSEKSTRIEECIKSLINEEYLEEHPDELQNHRCSIQ